MTPRCIICSNNTRYLLNKDSHDHYKCNSCGHIFVYPQPSYDELVSLYSPQTGYQRNKSSKQNTKQPVHNMYSSVINYAQQFEIKTILDIGCSTGDFLFMAQEAGFEVCGVEPNATTVGAARLRGLEIFRGYFPNVNLENKKFDMVFLGDVIEHVSNPKQFISEVMNVTNVGGFVVICTPNADCFWSRTTLLIYKVFGVPWSVATPPYHISIFTPTSLDVLLDQNRMTLQNRWYNHLPNLRYEIGSTRVWSMFKNSKSVRSVIQVIVVALLYPLIFVINKSTKFLGLSNMGMVSIYKKQN